MFIASSLAMAEAGDGEGRGRITQGEAGRHFIIGLGAEDTRHLAGQPVLCLTASAWTQASV